MTWLQRKWFERREREAAAFGLRRLVDGEGAAEALLGLSPGQRAALLGVLQRVIDGRVAILARSVDLPEGALREARGAIMGLEDLAEGLRGLWREA